MKIIVTGASGFFGPGIVERLHAAGHEVIPASRRSLQAPVDIGDAASCRALIAAHRGVDAVVHAAALAHVPPDAGAAAECERVNVHGTRNIADAAANAGISRFVFISSVTVYGDYDLPVPVTEDGPVRSTSLYGAAKRRAEDILAQYGGRLEVWTLRMSTMYAPDWLYNVRKRVSPPLVGRFLHFTLDPDRRRYTLCSRRNGAEAVLWSVEARLPPGTYNVSEPHVYSQREILRAVERVEGTRPHLPVPVLIPRAAASLARLIPGASVRENARSRYWKFCEHNVYSGARLQACGLELSPDLLDLGGPAS
ncbi:MAG TPA: NAD(P)-dependent oxidoreductase [Vicinamibacterales bacterium]|nr:NAD(P)-dependent oxidoreductase [Vicinamibacterales bacterium]